MFNCHLWNLVHDGLDSSFIVRTSESANADLLSLVTALQHATPRYVALHSVHNAHFWRFSTSKSAFVDEHRDSTAEYRVFNFIFLAISFDELLSHSTPKRQYLLVLIKANYKSVLVSDWNSQKEILSQSAQPHIGNTRLFMFNAPHLFKKTPHERNWSSLLINPIQTVNFFNTIYRS